MMADRKILPLREIDAVGVDIIPESLEYCYGEKGVNFLKCRLKTKKGWKKYQIPIPYYLYDVFNECWEKLERTEITLSPVDYGYEIIYPIVGTLKVEEGEM